MVAPLVGIAIAAAARLAAKKIAQEAAKKAAKTAATRARSNSAAAAKAVAPKNPSTTASKMKMAKTADARRKFDAASQKRILDNQVKNSVKVLPRKTAPKTGLEGRGAKLTSAQQKERAQALRFDKQERNYERSMENQYQVYNSGKDNKFFTSKPGKANVKKTETIKKAASAKLPIKINSNSSSRANRTRSGNKAK